MGHLMRLVLDSFHHQTRRLAPLGSVVSNLEIKEEIGKPGVSRSTIDQLYQGKICNMSYLPHNTQSETSVGSKGLVHLLDGELANVNDIVEHANCCARDGFQGVNVNLAILVEALEVDRAQIADVSVVEKLFAAVDKLVNCAAPSFIRSTYQGLHDSMRPRPGTGLTRLTVSRKTHPGSPGKRFS